MISAGVVRWIVAETVDKGSIPGRAAPMTTNNVINSLIV